MSTPLTQLQILQYRLTGLEQNLASITADDASLQSKAQASTANLAVMTDTYNKQMVSIQNQIASLQT